MTEHKVHVVAEWDEVGFFRIWGEDPEGEGYYAARAMRDILFAWHAASFYGTMLEEAVYEGREVVCLPAGEAVTFWADSPVSLHWSCTWSDSCIRYKETAQALQQALIQGRYVPVPKVEQGRAQVAWKVVGATDAEGESFLEKWLNCALEEWLASDRESSNVWSQMRGEQHVLDGAPVHEGWDEDGWLESIGFRCDDLPFSLGLRLAEPVSADDSWQLEPMLIDREDPRLVYACDAAGRPLRGERVPKRWREHIPAALQRAEARWRKLLPEFVWSMDQVAAWRFLEQDSRRLIAAGIPVYLPKWWDELLKQKPALRATLKPDAGGSGLFGADQLLGFDWRVAIGESELDEAEFHQMVKSGQRLIFIQGRWVPLHPAWVKAIRRYLDKPQAQRETMSLIEALELHLAGGRIEGASGEEEAADGELGVQVEVRLNRTLQEWLERLQQPQLREKPELPSDLAGVLRPYQQEGTAWMLLLREMRLGACLADDMGLGKTLQFISYLAKVHETDGDPRPSLLICPTSVLGNWQKELERFAPTLRVYLHYGQSRKKGDEFTEACGAAQLVLTSYALAHLDEEELAGFTWSAIGLDEAQNIKNPYGKQSLAVRRLSAAHRIALTGTPVENRLTELWSIFDFLIPGYLGSLSRFQRDYAVPIEKRADAVQTERLQRLIAPFLLRRTKKDPAIQLDLPDKQEATMYVTLTAEQGALYEAELQTMLSKLHGLDEMERRGAILRALTKLKQVCDHPAVYLGEERGRQSVAAAMQRSNKLARLAEMVQELRDEGERCLIFTQYIEMGEMIVRVLTEVCGESAQFLHGGLSKSERDRQIERFQDRSLPLSEQRNIFVLSLKAGGTGLNLTAANHVFHYDRWWNPAVEDQATDRAYRIGQTKDVQVHKFVALGTLEERIQEMIERKQQLSRQVVGAGEGWITEMSDEELKALFALRKEWVRA